MSRSTVFVAAALLGALALASTACSGGSDAAVAAPPGTKAVVYKTPTCSCCKDYVADMEHLGYNVEVVNMDDPTPKKAELGVPADMRTCHTTVIGDYFIEGHVPFEAVRRLLDEQPDVAGIALPGMPLGSPGMPGPKTEPLVVMAIDKDFNSYEFGTY